MRRRTRIQPTLLCLALLGTSFTVGTPVTAGDERIRRLPATRVTIDEDILAAFVDEPCHHFEAARDAFTRGDNKQAAQHLRVASAFLRLESARATADGRTALEASVAELHRLATALENHQRATLGGLQQAFSRAHYALAGYHCIQTARRCCRPKDFADRRAMNRAGQDLKAATLHLKHAASWNGGEPTKETQRALDAAQLTAEQLIRRGEARQSDVARAIRSVRDRLEDLTGRRIMLASPTTPDEETEPSIFR